MQRFVFTAAAGLAAALTLTSLALARNSTSSAVDGVAQQAMKTVHVPGLVIAVANGGAPPEIRAYGVSNVASATPIDEGTRFEIGSITKQFTAAAVLQLKEAGKLSLDDRLGNFVPQYATARNVTVRQLLWQVSGVPDYTDGADFDRLAATHAGSFAAILARVAKKPLHFPPGTQWEYSNTNFVLLGRIVEVASRTKWETYIRSHVFAPAGMTRSDFMNDEAALSDMATGYSILNGKAVRARAWDVGWVGAAGAIVSTAGDMLKWDDALFGGKVVSRDDLRLMTTPGRLGNGKPTAYGFGIDIEKQNGQLVFEHQGGTPGFGALNAVYPALRQTIVVLGNSPETSLMGARLFAALHPRLASSENAGVPGEDLRVTVRAKEWWHRLATGDVDRSQLTAHFRKDLTPQLIGQLKAHLAQLGDPLTWAYRGRASSPNGGVRYNYALSFKGGVAVAFSMDVTSDGKIASFQFE